MERRDVLSARLTGDEPAAEKLDGERLSRDEIIRRLAQPRAGEPSLRGDHMLDRLEPPQPPLKAAAVLVPIVEHDDQLTVLLTKRTDHLADHAGQISFPGGRIEPDDPDPEYAALREAREEVGLPAEQVQLIGRLDIYRTRTGFEVVPVVGLGAPAAGVGARSLRGRRSVRGAARLHPRPGQSRAAFARAARRHADLLRAALSRSSYLGATAGMLVNLAQVLRP
ncbi:MAG: CoA pyrophosphatase [Pseudomonadota bacterium]